VSRGVGSRLNPESPGVKGNLEKKPTMLLLLWKNPETKRGKKERTSET